MAEFTLEITHVPGADNVVADSLSRPPGVAARPKVAAAVVPPASTGPLSWKEVAADQATCPEIKVVLLSSSLQLQQVTIQSAEVWWDLSTDSIRPLIPSRHHRAVFEHVRSLSHAGTLATTRLVSSHFLWPGLASDIKEWCRECTACQRAKVTSVDLVGPIPTPCAGHWYLLTIIDRSSRWLAAETVLEAFITSWVARFGVVQRVTSDAIHMRHVDQLV